MLVDILDRSDLGTILQTNFTSSFRKGYISVKQITMPQRFGEMADEIAGWSVSNEDVWICSYPKTGTTWTQEMVWMIANNLDFERGQINLGQRSPFLEVSALFDYRDLMANNLSFQPPPFLVDSLAFVRSQPSPLNLKTHLPWPLLPDEIQDGRKKPKIIYVARNPKDTCISYYHHCKLLEGYTGTFEDFYKLFLAGKLSYGLFWDHVLPFWSRRHQSNVLFLKYEDMKQNLPKVIRQVSKFLGHYLSNEQVQILDKHLSFASMKLNKAVNYEMVVELNKKFKLIEHNGAFMRSGTVGNYKAIMEPEIEKKFDEWIDSNTKNTDYVI